MADMTLFFADVVRLFTVALGQRKSSKYFEQKHCFRDLMFFSADSENMKDIRIFSESALFRAEKFSVASEKIISESTLFSADFLNSETLGFQSWFSADLFWISSDIYTCRIEYQSMITQSEVIKTLEVVIKTVFLY